MQKITRIAHKTVLYLSVVMLAGGAPYAAYADDSTQSPPKENYVYNTQYQKWESNKWKWDPAAGKYVPVTTTVSPSPTPTPTPSPSAVIQQSSSASTTDAAQTVDASTETDIDTDSTTTNSLDSDAGTGSADVTRNTHAGDAVTGDADAQTTVINSVHSTVGDGDTTGVAHFTMNIYGDVTGDITIGPTIDQATVERDANLSSNTHVNNDDTIINNQKLNSTSGTASVTGNTTGGSATSGDANSVANVLNLINTIIAANKSFVGTINIHGNLNGDILVSPDFIPQLIASNKDKQVSSNFTMPLTSSVNDDQTIVNNVKLSATTGTASVANNTTAGNAKTGTATTNLTILNLTGHEVDAAKSLLVFVNVLGKWVGLIVDAPSGATSAALGSGVIKDNVTLSSALDIDNNAQIINNLDLSAASGDASVTGNTAAGDATTGDATASANIANISSSTFQVSDWFGVLFINVFGTWIGSFGVDTAAGTVVPLSTGHGSSPDVRFGFHSVPHTGSALWSAQAGESGDGSHVAAVTAAKSWGGPAPTVGGPIGPQESTTSAIDVISLAMIIGGFLLAGASTGVGYLRRLHLFRAETA